MLHKDLTLAMFTILKIVVLWITTKGYTRRRETLWMHSLRWWWSRRSQSASSSPFLGINTWFSPARKSPKVHTSFPPHGNGWCLGQSSPTSVIPAAESSLGRWFLDSALPRVSPGGTGDGVDWRYLQRVEEVIKARPAQPLGVNALVGRYIYWLCDKTFFFYSPFLFPNLFFFLSIFFTLSPESHTR